MRKSKDDDQMIDGPKGPKQSSPGQRPRTRENDVMGSQFETRRFALTGLDHGPTMSSQGDRPGLVCSGPLGATSGCFGDLASQNRFPDHSAMSQFPTNAFPR